MYCIFVIIIYFYAQIQKLIFNYLNFKTSINKAQVYFANVFTVQDFKTSIMISDIYNNFESVDVYLTDSVKATNTVKISFKKVSFISITIKIYNYL